MSEPAVSGTQQPQQTFAEYRRSAAAPPEEKTESAGAEPSPVEEKTAEPAPEPAPDKKTAPDDAINPRTKQRMSRLLNERAKEKARADMLEVRLREVEARLAGQQPQADAKPTLQAYLNSGKYKTYEEASEAWADDREKRMRDEIRRERATEERGKSVQAIKRAFDKSIDSFQKTHPDVEDMAEIVESVQSQFDDNASHISDAIVRSDNPAALIHYLSEHPEEIEKLQELSETRGLAHLGKLEDRIESGTKPTKTPLPKPPTDIGGRAGGISTYDQAMAKASEAKDFSAFRKAATAAKKAAGR